MGDGFSFIKIGPVGNRIGDKWDEKGHANIVQIFICHDDNGIKSIQFQYAGTETQPRVLFDRHGNANLGRKFDVVKLNYPAEYITWIKGGTNVGSSNVCSITFGTNCGEYGPYGLLTSRDIEFSFKLGEDRQFGGFHGTADQYSLKSIGVYLNPITTEDRPVSKNFVKREVC